jgi:phosphoribosylamine--glycine ligase
MRILIVGNGGREHAILWKLRRDAPAAQFFVTRPNGGMTGLCEPVEIEPTDTEALAGWAASRRIDLTVVGPEGPLAAGVADRFRAKGLPVFGPSREAARIESSKAFSKDLMREAGVPTAEYRTFSDHQAARDHVQATGAPMVVKASGLAAGKGAVVCESVEEALGAVDSMMGDLAFGEAGRKVVVEEFMEGEEISIFGITDGEDVIQLIPSQDHKRVGEGDTGLNTGGMGAYAPVSIATPSVMEEARYRVFLPTLAALSARGTPFQGVLYAGLMLTDDGLEVVEFNCRFGDPETQVVLPMMESSLLDLLVAVAEGSPLQDREVRWRPGAALTTVVASGGYPGPYGKGKRIELPPTSEDVVLFHAGTLAGDDGTVTAGGRVIAATGLGSSLVSAAEKSRRAAEAIRFEGKQFRRDIGWRELERTAAPSAPGTP